MTSSFNRIKESVIGDGVDLATQADLGVLQNFKANGNSMVEKVVSEFRINGVNPLWFGADPTGVNDSTQAIIDTLSFMKSNNFKKIKFPEVNGTFLVTKPIIVDDDNIELDGGNNLFKKGATYSLNGFPYTSIFFLGNTTGTYRKNITFKRFRFDSFPGHTVRAKYIDTLNISDLFFTNGAYESIFIGASSNVDINRVSIDGSGVHGISFDSIEDSVDVRVSNWTVRNSVIKNCKWLAIDGHSAVGTFGKVIDNDITNCSHFTKNESGKAYVVGNRFVQDSSFVSQAVDNQIVYFRADDLVFENNYVEINGNSGTVNTLINLYTTDTKDINRMWIRRNKLIANVSTKFTIIIINHNAAGGTYRFKNCRIEGNFIKASSTESSLLYFKNVDSLILADNYIEGTVSGTLATGGYYGLLFDVYVKDVILRNNQIVYKGALNSKVLRVIHADTVANGLMRLDNNITDITGVTGGTAYHMQFIRGTGYKVLSNHYAIGGGSLVLGTDVADQNNYTTGVTVSKL